MIILNMASMVPFFAALVLMIVGKELGSSQAFSLNGFTNDVLHFDQEQYMLHGSKLFQHLQIPDFLATFKTKTKDESKWTCGKSYCYYCFDIQDHKVCAVAALYTNPTLLVGGATLDGNAFLLSTVKCNTVFCAYSQASFPNMEYFCMDFEDVTLSDKSASANVTLYYEVGKKPYKLPLGPFTIPPKKMSLFE